MTDEAALTQSLQVNLHVDPSTVAAALHAPGVRPDEFVPIVTVPRPAYEAVKPVIYPVPGLEFRSKRGLRRPDDRLRQHPARHGRTRHRRAAPPRSAARTRPPTPSGPSGLEAAYERSLAGTPTADIRVVDTSIADHRHNVSRGARASGRPRPRAAAHDHRSDRAAGGRVGPGVGDPAGRPRGHRRAGQRAGDRVGTGRLAVRPRPLRRVPAGSTFKVVTTDALLSAGVTPSSTLTCPGTITVDGRTFHNFESESLGRCRSRPPSPSRATPRSSARPAQHLSASSLRAAARTFGFDQPLHLGITAVGGSFPTSGDAVETAADAIGQGKVTASPLQMASVAAAVMSGQWHPPTLAARPHHDRGTAPGAAQRPVPRRPHRR